MFELPEQKLFKDVIHGYIKIPRCFVENIVDTAIFQRLRNIEQTGMRVLYPDAKHDRFGHSLGVFHLGCQAVDAFLENFRNSKSKYWYVRSDDSLNAFWAKNKVLFLIACLLHDIGHAPFSHAMENELHMDAGAEKFDTELAELLEIEYGELAKQKSASHEKIGAFLIIKHLKEPVRKILKYLNANFPQRLQSALVVEPKTSKSFVNTDDIEEDMRFIARMVLGLKYSTKNDKKNFEPEKQIKNCFIDLLNGNNFDVDKLDYIMRDTQVSGIKNTSIDVERLLGAISIVTLTNYGGTVNESFSERTLIQSIKSDEKLNDADDNAKLCFSGYVDGTLILKRNSEIEIKENTEIAEMRRHGDEEGKITLIEDVKFVAHSREHSHVNFGGSEYLAKSGEEEYKYSAILPVNVVNNTTCFIKNSTIHNKFWFRVVAGEFSLTFKGVCNVSITGDFKSDSPFVINKSDADGNINGTSIQLTVVDDRIKNEVPTFNRYNMFSIGFKKSAVGNISSVLDARDNLYKWIYAHHKVMYYANFLIPVVTQKLLQEELTMLMTSDNIENKILTIDDAFVWTHIKKQYQEYSTKLDEEIKKLVSELVKRKYKNSLFKSLPEYDVLFETFTVEKKDNMYKMLRDHVKSANQVFYNRYIEQDKVMRDDVGNITPKQEITAGFVNTEFINEIYNNNCEPNYRIKNLVWLAAQYKYKELDIKTIYLIYEDNDYTPTTLSRIDLLSNALYSPNNDTSHYFYLYFDVEEISGETADEKKKRERKVREKLSNALVKYNWSSLSFSKSGGASAPWTFCK